MVFVRVFGNSFVAAAAAISSLAALYKMTGALPTVAAFVLLHQSGALPPAFFPPLFSIVYKLYVSETIGYKYLRHMVHPRVAEPHTRAWAGARVLGQPQLLQKSNDGFGDPFGATSGVLVAPIPVLADNYATLILCAASGECAIVDPGDHQRVLDFVAALEAHRGQRLRITHVLCTHRHWDHAGANLEMQIALRRQQREDECGPQVRFVGSKADAPMCTDTFVGAGDVVHVGARAHIRVAEAPGHTIGSVMFLVADTEGLALSMRPQLALITGDAIFCGGCGAMFETKEASEVLRTYDVFHNPATFLHPGAAADSSAGAAAAAAAAIPDSDILIYVGHEYSQRLFAEIVERNRGRRREKGAARAAGLRDEEENCLIRFKAVTVLSRRKECTVPSTLHLEKATNPLLTLDRDALLRLAAKGPAVTVAEIEAAVYLSEERRGDLPRLASS